MDGIRWRPCGSFRLARWAALVATLAATARGDTVRMKNDLVYKGTVHHDETLVAISDGVRRVLVRDSKVARIEGDSGVRSVETFEIDQPSDVRGGTMPSIDRHSLAWQRASAIARIAHEGLWDSQAGDALYFHARSVHPSWSRTKIARATISSHVFYR